MTGEIPAELSDLSNLTELDLAANELTGEIPDWLGSLSRLEVLSLRGNQLTGMIPPGLSSLSNLKELSLSSNRLRGEIPAWLGSLSSLETLNLQSNWFSGEIPPELGELTELRVLYLQRNQLTGCIPEGLRTVGGDLHELNLPFCEASSVRGGGEDNGASPRSTSTPAVVSVPTATPSPTAMPTATLTPSPAVAPTATPTPSPAVTPTQTPTPSPTVTPQTIRAAVTPMPTPPLATPGHWRLRWRLQRGDRRIGGPWFGRRGAHGSSPARADGSRRLEAVATGSGRARSSGHVAAGVSPVVIRRHARRYGSAGHLDSNQALGLSLLGPLICYR